MGTRTLRLHIGPNKTGSTSVQAALDANVGALSSAGLLYPRSGWRPSAGQFDALCDFVTTVPRRLPPVDVFVRHYVLGGGRSRRGLWASLVDEVNGHHGTSIVSSEFLSRFDGLLVSQLVEQLPDHHFEIVMVSRPARGMLPSLYQENAKRQAVPEFEDYVRHALTVMTSGRRSSFDGVNAHWVRRQWAEAGEVTMVDASTGMGSDVIRQTCMALSPLLHDAAIPALNQGMSATGVQLWRIHLASRRPKYVGALQATLSRMLRTFPVAADSALGGSLRLSAAAGETLSADSDVHQQPDSVKALLASGQPLTEPTPSLSSIQSQYPDILRTLAAWQSREDLKWSGLDLAAGVLPRPRPWRMP